MIREKKKRRDKEMERKEVRKIGKQKGGRKERSIPVSNVKSISGP